MDETAEPAVRAPLSRERVLRAALALADEGGLESLSMRRLADELGVKAMSLYNHVPNKGAIVDGIVDLVVREIELPDGGDWEAAIRTCAVSAHEAFLRHPWACSLVMSPGRGRDALEARLRYMEWLLGRLRGAGFGPGLTYRGYHALDSHILGFTLWQLGHSAGAAGVEDVAAFAEEFLRALPPSSFPHLAEHIHQHLHDGVDGASEFEFGLDLILDGLKRARDAA